MPSRIRTLAITLACFSIGCSGFGSEDLSVDAEVTWISDVRELLATNCVRCHQATPQNGAPSGFRFDKYNRAEIDDGKDGALEKLARIEARAVLQRPSAMPPGGTLTVEQRAVLSTWIAAGGPLGSDAGRSPHPVTKP